MSLSETRTSPRPTHSSPGCPISWPGNNMTGLLSWIFFLSSWRLVQSASGLTIQNSQSRPSLCLQQHQQQQSCSARRERSDGRQAEQYGCVLFFMHAFWMAQSTIVIALLSGFRSQALLLSYFITVLSFSIGLFSAPCVHLASVQHVNHDILSFLPPPKCPDIHVPLMLSSF